MPAIEATPRTINAIKKADSLANSKVPGSLESRNLSVKSTNIRVDYGNSYIVKILESRGNGIYKASLLDDYGNGVRTVYISSLDVMLSDTFVENQLVQVTDSNINYAQAVSEQ